jgi:hypothetical protein
MRCPICNSWLPRNARFCQNCGNLIQLTRQPLSFLQKLLAAIGIALLALAALWASQNIK